MSQNRILFIDAYDSFSNSIIALLQAQLPVLVESIKIDDARFVLNTEAFHHYLDGFDAVVAGPGPGHPANREDIGLIAELWNLPPQHSLPVLGICLGFQSLCLAFGGRVQRLNDPRHGIMAIITHCERDIFTGAKKVVATQYHSLHVSIHDNGTTNRLPDDLWVPSANCPDLVPLAWDMLNSQNGAVLMAVRHSTRPLWGVQYHPESVCTSHTGQDLITDWWREACKWLQASSKRAPVPTDPSHSPTPNTRQHSPPKFDSPLESPLAPVVWRSVKCHELIDVASLSHCLERDDQSLPPLILESAVRNGKPVNPETGRFSIIGLHHAGSLQVRYSSNNHRLEAIGVERCFVNSAATIEEAFTYCERLMRIRKAGGGPPESPFWGGLVGYISYEAGLQTIGVGPPVVPHDHPDLWFTFVQRSIVVDHIENIAYVQSLCSDDDDWLESTATLIETGHGMFATPTDKAAATLPPATIIREPNKIDYLQRVRDCQSHLRAGESYELCLTDQTLVNSSEDPWSFYLRLRQANPAPFSSFLRMQSLCSEGLSIVSSSPERFLSWTRHGRCQFRPIKGTVKKAPGVTRAHAEEILGSTKERAENLMIVDLIRHDLNGVTGTNGVKVPKLMSIEEYETVFQLVSVIEGDLTPGASGIAALSASLPPGSMTGAPKKRSCELLKTLEDNRPRGLYSGVIGFLDVGGAGDFSVVIRTTYKWDDEPNTWHIGAGGAVTALSDPEAEYDEMLTKRETVLRTFMEHASVC